MLTLSSCIKSGTEDGRQVASSAGGAAPDFVLQDTKGNEVRLSQYRGKVVLLEFWATWCPPCKATIPDLVAVQGKYGSKGLVVLGVSLDEGADLSAKLDAFTKQYKINYPVLLGTEDIPAFYNVRSIPMTFLIDKEGKIVDSHMGYSDKLEPLISEQIDKIL